MWQDKLLDSIEVQRMMAGMASDTSSEWASTLASLVNRHLDSWDSFSCLKAKCNRKSLMRFMTRFRLYGGCRGYHQYVVRLLRNGNGSLWIGDRAPRQMLLPDD